MVSLRDIKKRITSIEKINKITNAMKMVSIAKFKKNVVLYKKNSQYINAIKDILNRIKCDITQKDIDVILRNNALLRHNKTEKICLLVLTSNKGLCGAFNNKIIKSCHVFIQNCEDVHIINIGRKGLEYFKKHPELNVQNINNNMLDLIKISKALSHSLHNDFKNQKYKSLWIIGNCFISAGSQVVQTKQILPLTLDKDQLNRDQNYFIYEPSKIVVFNKATSDYFNNIIYQSLLNSTVSEHAARMKSMENATKNAQETFTTLSLQYNRLRQANITKELMEIISGAEALK